MAVIVQYVFKAVPGTSVAKFMEQVQSGAALWKKHGAAPRVWTVSVGEIGNTAFSAEFKSYSDYAKVMEALTADPDFRAWQAKSQESGTSEWVRSNLLRELTH